MTGHFKPLSKQLQALIDTNTGMSKEAMVLRLIKANPQWSPVWIRYRTGKYLWKKQARRT